MQIFSVFENLENRFHPQNNFWVLFSPEEDQTVFVLTHLTDDALLIKLVKVVPVMRLYYF